VVGPAADAAAGAITSGARVVVAAVPDCGVTDGIDADGRRVGRDDADVA
jgi:hypothetical protein